MQMGIFGLLGLPCIDFQALFGALLIFIFFLFIRLGQWRCLDFHVSPKLSRKQSVGQAASRPSAINPRKHNTQIQSGRYGRGPM